MFPFQPLDVESCDFDGLIFLCGIRLDHHVRPIAEMLIPVTVAVNNIRIAS